MEGGTLNHGHGGEGEEAGGWGERLSRGRKSSGG